MNKPRIETARLTSSLPLIGRLVSTYLRPHFGRLAVAISFMILSAGMTALFARMIQPVMDDVLVRASHDSEARGMIIPVGFMIFLCFFLRGIASYGQSLQMIRIGQGVIADIQNDLFRHLVRLDLAFFHANPSGQLASRMVSDVNVMRYAVTDALTGIGNSVLTLLFLCGVMIYQDWQLSIIALAVLPLASGMVAYLGRRLRKISHSLQDGTAILMDRLAEIFGGIRQVQAYGMEEGEQRHAATAIDQVRRLNVKPVRVGEMITPVNEMLVGLAIFAIVVYGGFKIADGHASAGSLLSFIAAFALAYEPMKKLGKLNNTMQLGLGAAERVFALLDTQSAIADHPEARDVYVPGPPTIQFQDVSFRYGGTDADVLSDVSILFPAGKVSALVGPSGGGKTTILNMILRFYDPHDGQVMINGYDLRTVKMVNLRRHIALVSQDISIFNMSIRENIAYGRAGATDADITAAARAAAAHDFIAALPQGYDTVAGENGILLSGGQRQRIAIARAILRDAPILLLDEATSALDNESEKIIQQSLDLLGRGRTTIVVAHRLSTIRHADQIVVMDGGAVAEVGTHDELVARGGVYARLLGATSRNETGEAA